MHAAIASNRPHTVGLQPEVDFYPTPLLPETPRAWLSYLCTSRHKIRAGERLSLLLNLRELWQRHADGMDPVSSDLVAELAEYLCDWPLLAELSESRSAGGLHCAGTPARQYILARWHTGDSGPALGATLSRLLAQPADTSAFDLYKSLHTWLAHRQQQCQGSFSDLEQGHLRLEPLWHHHCESFFWQYLDSDIPERCCLPVFENLEQWHLWLEEEMDLPGKRTFAILHDLWGMIGVVSLTQYKDIGLFYYWVGADFRGQGYAPLAIATLLRHSRIHTGLRHCYAKVYRDNQRSIGGLRKLGFQPLPFLTRWPHTNEQFYCLSDQESHLAHKSNLTDLLNFMECDIELI